MSNFALKAKTAVKKVTALSAGAVMLGATIAGAAAQSVTLTDYPAPFVQNGKYNMLPVYGDTSKGDDISGAWDILAGLAGSVGGGSIGGGSTVVVTGGESDEIPLGSNITGSGSASNFISSGLDDDDIESFIDTEITFAGSSYEVHDELQLGFSGGVAGNVSTVRPVTSLLSGDDDYESGVFLESKKGQIGYFYFFDEVISVENTTSTSDPLEIQFLGKNLKIIEITGATKFKAYVGDEYFMNVGDRVTADGKTVTLENVGQSSILVDVDGVKATITNGGTKTVNGIEVTVDELFYRTQIESSSANLVVGKDSSEEIKDGDEYFGGDDNCNDDPDDPDCWKFIVNGLDSNARGDSKNVQGPTIGIKNDFNLLNDDDNPPAPGDCINLPNNYASICLDSLSVADTDYATYTIAHETNADLTDSGLSALGNVKTLEISAEEGNDDGLTIRTAGLWRTKSGFTDATETDRITLFLNDSEILVFYRDSENKDQLAGHINGSESFLTFAEIDYQDTKGTNLVLQAGQQVGGAFGAPGFNLSIKSLGDEVGSSVGLLDDNLHISVRNDTSGITGFGRTVAEADGTDLSWCDFYCGSTNVSTSLGSKDEDHRTSYGIIIRDPESGFDNDEFTFEVPGDQVFANIVVKGTSTTVTSAGGSVVVTDVAPPMVKASEVTVPENDNIMLVGGPVVNSLTARFVGSTWTYAPGEAIIELHNNGANVALVVAGTDAVDTRRAARVLRDYTRFRNQLTGRAVKVTGSSPSFTDTVISANA